MKIESPNNEKIKRAALLKDKRQRDKTGLFIVEGIKQIREIKDGWEVREIFVLDGCGKDENDFLKLSRPAAKVFTVLPAVANKIASTKTTQGFFAVVKKKVFDLDKVLSEGKKFIFLENIADPGNLGTIIRTADAFGFSGVFVSKGSADVFLDKTLRSSMGSIFNIPVIDNISSKELFERVKMFGVSAYAASLSASKDLRDLKIAKKAMICVGNESKGLSGDVLGACDECFKVAMAGKIQSLNAAVAASIIMFEVSKPKSLARS